MQVSGRIEIRLLTESDIPAAMKLKESAGWNQTENDWRCLLQLEPFGCFAAILDGELVGTTTTTTYDDQLAWIGMVLVQPEKRRLGIATKLLKTALDYLNGNVARVKLDATPAGRPVYERFGFQFEGLIERWIGTAAFSEPGNNPKPTASMLDADLFALDRSAFNANRSKLIEILIANSLAGPVVSRSDDGILTGYALARRGSRANYVGPLVTRNPEAVEVLLDRMLEQMAGERLYFDFNTGCICDSAVLVARGLVKERELVRMRKGPPDKGTSPFVVAIAGPEVG
jgi:RimJ/RimL family protein N-acetyltransferase